MLIYRLDLSQPPDIKPLPKASRFHIVADTRGIFVHFLTWVRNWGWGPAIKAAFKIWSRRRILFYTIVPGGAIAQSGWANLGFCHYYPIESDAVVLGTLFTLPSFRRQGFSTGAKSRVMAYLYARGYRRFYSDTTPANVASQRTSEKLGFKRVAELNPEAPASVLDAVPPLAVAASPVPPTGSDYHDRSSI